MGMPKPYRYKKKSRRTGQGAHFDLDRLERLSVKADEIPLTGFVNGLKASDLEERVARALRMLNVEFGFQVPFETSGSLPGQEKNVDFVVQAGGMFIPIAVDGKIGHNTSAQKGKDSVRETLLNEVFKRYGLRPLVRIKWDQVDTQALAVRTIRQLLGI